jgi:hypothetical protein
VRENTILWYAGRQRSGSFFLSSNFVTTLNLFRCIQSFREANIFSNLRDRNTCGAGSDCYIEFSESSDAQLPFATKLKLTAGCVMVSTARNLRHENKEIRSRKAFHGADI